MQEERVTLTFEEFKVIYDAVYCHAEFSIYFRDSDNEYMIIKLDDRVSFQRCGYYNGSGEVFYDSLFELCKAVTVDDICLERDWDKVTDIIVGSYRLFIRYELEELCERYGIKLQDKPGKYMSDIKVRKATPEDSTAICRLSIDDLGYECDETLVRQRLTELDHEREEVFVTVTEGEVAGYIHAEVYKTLYYEAMMNYLGLAVSKKFRRRGVGSSLVSAAEQWAEDKGIRLVRVNSGETRAAAHEFYRRLGYGSEKGQKRFVKELYNKQDNNQKTE